MQTNNNWLDAIRWDASGLVPVIAQERSSGDVLMVAWMNREALQKTAELGRAVYFSRSRGKLWFKGEIRDWVTLSAAMNETEPHSRMRP